MNRLQQSAEGGRPGYSPLIPEQVGIQSDPQIETMAETRVWAQLLARELDRERQGFKNDWHEAAIQLSAILGVLINQ